MTSPVESMLDGIMPRLICFVCTGNTCRSPMAAAVFNMLAEKNDLPLRAISAGLYVSELSISDNAVRALEIAGVESTPTNNYREHIACNINEAIVSECERIIGISSAHAMELISRFPRHANKISAMPYDISDPYGGDIERYGRCLDEITKAISEEFFK